MFGGVLQPAHLILILVIVLIVFGPGKLPEIGGSLGKSINEFKRGFSSDSDAETKSGGSEPPSTPQPGVCPTCGTESPTGNQFCGKCGAKLS
ncbi:MAG: twin-arginine translocase TatA/TatE family subunit [Chloroflexi bacterium]|nr:twin-arginine translocase TatA/TatE family subunit [Chloroflexota bacterium]